MAIIFSPLANEEMTGAFKPLPGCAFVMIHSAASITPVELEIERQTRFALRQNGFRTVKAAGTFGTKDYLDKILQLIRGCGFGIAVFSEFTPPRTLANIFFEIGICYVLGKDVILIKTPNAAIPSDFVRNEWVEFKPAPTRSFVRSMSAACRAVRRSAAFYSKLGQLALAEDAHDLELAFERFKQAALIVNDPHVRAQIRQVSAQLAVLSRESVEARNHFKRLKGEVDRFLKLYPRRGRTVGTSA